MNLPGRPHVPARSELAAARRIVVKFGTHVVTHDGIELAAGRVHALLETLARLRRRGLELVLVSSGAVGMGMRALSLQERPRSLGLRQACAAVGQGHLMALYTQAFAQLGVTAAQVLLTQDDLADRDRALCVRTTLMRLLELGALPVLNENDSVSVRELIEIRIADGGQGPEVAFGDNDGLSALVARALDADLLVLLTDVDGLYTANPRIDPDARRIPDRLGVADDDRGRADGSSGGGTGGMASKLAAAQLVTEAGIPAAIVGADAPQVLTRLLAGEDLGTVFWPTAPRPARRRALAQGPRTGALVVNDGAIAALLQRKASLLPIGVLQIEGEFDRGDLVEIRDRSGRVFGRGLVNYGAAACRSLAGHHSTEIDAILGYRGYDALVTRDNLVLTTDGR
ncbi:MAG: glutamate 5-kinase [Deltaproteobacteria bacterium]|nr:glutamate 5-kinase [Deltaproteobacteria bacterium]MBK8239239.1 glutamate 5-kinase [Deltaproteobacteria bacterium]MBK8719685.1 glutamate 5-kinase [Deltaproteobacteria bacterium]